MPLHPAKSGERAAMRHGRRRPQATTTLMRRVPIAAGTPELSMTAFAFAAVLSTPAQHQPGARSRRGCAPGHAARNPLRCAEAKCGEKRCPSSCQGGRRSACARAQEQVEVRYAGWAHCISSRYERADPTWRAGGSAANEPRWHLRAMARHPDSVIISDYPQLQSDEHAPVPTPHPP